MLRSHPNSWSLARRWRIVAAFLVTCAVAVGLASPAVAVPIDVITVDVSPFGLGGPVTTMGQALQMVDQGGDFNVTEVTPVAFSGMSAADLSAFDLIAINNSPIRIAGGLGATWQGVVGVNAGGRVMLNSHDAPRFHKNFVTDYFSGPGPGLGFAPFGAPDLVRQAALWAGNVPGQTGMLIFNDSYLFQGGSGWDNPELNLPAAWGISDVDPFGGAFGIIDGGYTDIIPSLADAVYDGTLGAPLSDVRFGVNSISSFAANIGDASYHTIFDTFNAAIFSTSEVVINAGDVDVGNVFPGGALVAPLDIMNGKSITIVREGLVPEPSSVVLMMLGLATLVAFVRRRATTS